MKTSRNSNINLDEFVGFGQIPSKWNKFIDQFKSQVPALGQFIRDELRNGVGNAFVEAFDAIGNALATGGNVFKSAGNAILRVIGEFMKKLGKEAIRLATLGIAFANTVKAIKKWIIANPTAAIAASLSFNSSRICIYSSG